MSNLSILVAIALIATSIAPSARANDWSAANNSDSGSQAALLLAQAEEAEAETTGAEDDKPLRNYFGIGGGIGLSGDTTSLGDGGFAIVSKTGFTDRLSLHNATVFGDRNTSTFALTVDFPILSETSDEVIYTPFLGGGIIADSLGDFQFQIDPMAIVGVDVPLSERFMATARTNVAFLDDDTDIGLIVGVGYRFNGFFGLFN